LEELRMLPTVIFFAGLVAWLCRCLHVGHRRLEEAKQAQAAVKEEALRSSQLLTNLQTVATGGNEILWLATPDAKELLVMSANASETFGRPAQHLMETPSVWLQAIHPEDLEAFSGTLAGLAETGEANVRYRVRRQDGSIRWIEDHVVGCFAGTGELLAIGGRARDITGTIDSETKLALFGKFAETSDQGFLMAALTGRIVYANPAIARMLGRDVDAVIGSQLQSHYPFSVRRRVEKLIKDLPQKERWQGELALLGAKGGLHHTSESFFLIRDDDGNPRYIANTVADITSQRLATQAASDSRRLGQAILNNLPAGILFLDSGSRIRQVNDRWLEIAAEHGVTETDLISKGEFYGNACTRMWPSDAEAARMLGDLVEEVEIGARPALSHEFRCRLGQEERWFLVNAAQTEDGRGVVVSHQDITSQKLLEMDVRQERDFAASVITSAGEGICVFEIDDDAIRFLEWNARMGEITGYNIKEANAKGWQGTIFRADSAESTQARLKQITESKNLREQA
jgi:PAS domain S-box-containing protein